MKGEHKIVKEFYIYIKQHLVEFKNIKLEKNQRFCWKNQDAFKTEYFMPKVYVSFCFCYLLNQRILYIYDDEI